MVTYCIVGFLTLMGLGTVVWPLSTASYFVGALYFVLAAFVVWFERKDRKLTREHEATMARLKAQAEEIVKRVREDAEAHSREFYTIRVDIPRCMPASQVLEEFQMLARSAISNMRR